VRCGNLSGSRAENLHAGAERNSALGDTREPHDGMNTISFDIALHVLSRSQAPSAPSDSW
jgi:hypothetical protein